MGSVSEKVETKETGGKKQAERQTHSERRRDRDLKTAYFFFFFPPQIHVCAHPDLVLVMPPA